MDVSGVRRCARLGASAIRRLTGAVVCAAALMGVLAAFAPSRSLAAECKNEAIREQQGATYLPECRAYEMVSPLGSAPGSEGRGERIAAADGERYLYYSQYPYPGEKSDGQFLLSTRGETGWSTESITPPQGGVNSTNLFACSPSVLGSVDLTSDVLVDGVQEEAHRYCEGDVPELVPGEPRGVANLFLQREFGGAYQLLDMPPAGAAAANAALEDATPDLSDVVFSEPAQLIPEALGNYAINLYEWGGGGLHVVTVLPSKAVVEGVLADGSRNLEAGFPEGVIYNGAASERRALSEDGETVFFYAEGNLYARENATQEQAKHGECSAEEPGKACTVEVDKAAAKASGASGHGLFYAANAGGDRVFFTDESALTPGAGAGPGAPDLYEYDLATRTLNDLTPSATSPADVEGVVNVSQDGGYVYFVARAVLSGEQKNEYGAKAIAGQPNLYVRHAGLTTYIATLNEGDFRTWGDVFKKGERNGDVSKSRVSANGEYLAFDSSGRLTGAASCGSDCQEIFLYHAADNSLACASCAARGVTPTAGAELQGEYKALISGGPYLESQQVLSNGEVIFESAQPLVARVTDGATNVYEYDHGEVSLISSGTGAGPSLYAGMSGNGSNVFFSTGQGLVASDTDNAPSVYDARVDGGFPAGAATGGAAGPCEEAIACRPPGAEPPVEALGASAVFNGPKDLTPSEGSLPEPTSGAVHQKGSQSHARKRRHGAARRRKLRRALKRCERRPKPERKDCRRRAKRRFAKRRHTHKNGARHRRPRSQGSGARGNGHGKGTVR